MLDRSRMILIQVLEVFDLRINSNFMCLNFSTFCSRSFWQLIRSSFPNLIKSLLSNETPVSTIPSPPPPTPQTWSRGPRAFTAVVFSTPFSIYEHLSYVSVYNLTQLTNTRLIRKPHHYGHFPLSLGEKPLYFVYLTYEITINPLKRTPR